MRAHLTRNVCRRVLASHGPVQPCRALSSRALPIRESRSFRPRVIVRRPSRRSFFGLFKKPPRELKEPELEPGYLALLQFTSRGNNNFRLPPREELLKGFQTFFRYKARGDVYRPMNTTQAFLAVPLLQHLLETSSEGEDELTLFDLRLARDVALQLPNGKTDDHLKLSRELYAEIKRRLQSLGPTVGNEASPEDFNSYIRALTQYGASLEASELLESYFEDGETKYPGAKNLWVSVLRGFAAEGREEELKRLAEDMKRRGVRYGQLVHETMTTFFAKRDNIVETKRWFERQIHDGKKPTAPTYSAILRFAMRNKHQQWAQPIFQQAMDTSLKKETWDVALQWLVLGMSKGVEDIKKTILAMTDKAGPAQRDGLVPDSSTINSLIEAAMERKDPYLAERFVNLGSELGIEPDSRTYLLQMDYRLEAKDFSGAQAIYEKLEVTQAENDADMPMVNKYIRALCSVDEPDTEQILDITSMIEQRSLTLEPETTLALCTTLLRTDKQYDVIDTLSLHTVQYSLEDRELVRTGFVQYCLDKKTSTARVWDAYSLLRQFFPETEPQERLQLIEAFFERKRPDMACRIFAHMRAHQNPSQRPTADIYVKCLEGIGRYPDDESLQMVHNMLKMDSAIQMSTKLYNALMLAYAGCDRSLSAFDFWTNITNSAEGPSYNSLAIVFRVCEALPFGDRKARPIWQKLQRMDLDIPPLVYGSYCAAIASEGHVEEVKKLLQGMDASIGCSPNLPM